MEYKVQVGGDLRYRWKSPAYISAPPVLTVDGDVVAGLALIHPDVDVLSTSDQVLTSDGDVDAPLQGVTGARGDAHFWTDAEGTLPVRVQDIEGDQIHIAEQLRDGLGAGVLQWSTWEVTIPAATLGAAERRNVPVLVAYVAQFVAGVDEPGVRRDLVHVVAQIFSTDLDHHTLVAALPSLLDQINVRADSYAAQIQVALAELLEEHVRPPLQPVGLTEDAILSGNRLQRAHIYFTQAVILDDLGRTEDAEAARKRGRESAAAAMVAIIADLDGDGEPDDEVSSVGSGLPTFAGGGGFPTRRCFTDPGCC